MIYYYTLLLYNIMTSAITIAYGMHGGFHSQAGCHELPSSLDSENSASRSMQHAA